MTNPFEPPKATVDDIGTAPRSSWLRVGIVIVACSAGALVLSWIVVTWLLSEIMGTQASRPSAIFLACDLALSCLAFTLACSIAAQLVFDRRVAAAVGVAVVGWIFYFTEVGGLSGILNSEFPLWYEVFPSHFVAAGIALFIASRFR